MPSTHNFVLVHGAWHGGWCWRRVIADLRSAGHFVFAPTLTGSGERIHLTRAGLTLDDFATDVVNLIAAEELNDVILVGHSFGGNVISAVADREPKPLKDLVYVDTLVLKNGESGFSVLDPTGVGWLKRRLTPLSLNCYQAPIRLKHPLGNGVKKTYIGCTNPVYAPAIPTHDWVKSQSDWRYFELATAHDAMVTDPEGLAGMLAQCG
jgi:pimeloyl-ACP methyl ester carboxylesterase